MIYRPSRRLILGGMAAAPILGASPIWGLRPARAQTLDKFSYQTNWRAQAEHGGFYQARGDRHLQEARLDVEMRQGGPQLDVNRSCCWPGASTWSMIERVPRPSTSPGTTSRALAIAAIFQKDPQVLHLPSRRRQRHLAALKGKPILIGAGGRTSATGRSCKAKYGYTDEQIRPYTFNMAPFLADKNITQQGFIIVRALRDPQGRRRSGRPSARRRRLRQLQTPRSHLAQDGGGEEGRGAALRRRHDRGLGELLKGGPATAANALIKKDNPDMTDDKIDYAIKVMNETGHRRCRGDAIKLGIGAMTAARWKSFYETMVDCRRAARRASTSRRPYSLEFVNKGVGA